METKRTRLFGGVLQQTTTRQIGRRNISVKRPLDEMAVDRLMVQLLVYIVLSAGSGFSGLKGTIRKWPETEVLRYRSLLGIFCGFHFGYKPTEILNFVCCFSYFSHRFHIFSLHTLINNCFSTVFITILKTETCAEYTHMYTHTQLYANRNITLNTGKYCDVVNIYYEHQR